MSDAKKAAIQAAKTLLTPPSLGFVGLPPGVRVIGVAGASGRFPLPLTIASGVLAAFGVFAMWRGYRVIGLGLLAIGGAGIGAAAAAPELTKALNDLGG